MQLTSCRCAHLGVLCCKLLFHYTIHYITLYSTGQVCFFNALGRLFFFFSVKTVFFIQLTVQVAFVPIGKNLKEPCTRYKLTNKLIYHKKKNTINCCLLNKFKNLWDFWLNSKCQWLQKRRKSKPCQIGGTLKCHLTPKDLGGWQLSSGGGGEEPSLLSRDAVVHGWCGETLSLLVTYIISPKTRQRCGSLSN